MNRLKAICASATLTATLALGAGQASAAEFIVDTTADTTDAGLLRDGECADADGNCSLRAALQEANASEEADLISLAPGTIYPLTIEGSEDLGAAGDLDISSEITISGDGSTVDANGIDRAFDVLAGGIFRARALSVTNGAPASGESGGLLRTAGITTWAGGTLSNGTVTGDGASGGAVLNAGGLIMRNVVVRDSSAVRAGGGIEAEAGSDTTLRLTRLAGNSAGSAPGNGGALHITGDGEADLRKSRVIGNSAASEGGGLWNGTGEMTLRNTVVKRNVARGDGADEGGGGIFNSGGTIKANRTRVEKNRAPGSSGSGGGLLNDAGVLASANSRFIGNRASRAGGGIETVGGELELFKVRLVSNQAGSAPGNGGGLHVTGFGEVEIRASLVRRNIAASEGGGLWNNTGQMKVRGTTLVGNSARGSETDQGGGALFNEGGSLKVFGGEVRKNRANRGAGSGGGALNNGGNLDFVKTVISRNRSARAGGGVESVGGTNGLTSVRLVRNRTGAEPGNGGGVHLTGDGSVSVNRSLVARNRAAAEGGGLWNSAEGNFIVKRSTIRANRAPDGRNAFNDGGRFLIDGKRCGC